MFFRNMQTLNTGDKEIGFSLPIKRSKNHVTKVYVSYEHACGYSVFSSMDTFIWPVHVNVICSALGRIIFIAHHCQQNCVLTLYAS